MEGPSPLTRDDPRARILLSGWHDWVSLDEARHLVGTAVSPSTSSADLRTATLAAVDHLLLHGLVLAGDLVPDFRAWDLDPGASSQRIAELWDDPDAVLRPGDVCWLATTRAGDDLADRLHRGGGAPSV